jgi:hypothetical protein
MSDVQMDTPDSSVHGTRHTRMAKPDLYYGERLKLETWILQFDRYFHMAGDAIESDDYVITATSYMKGDAEKWVAPLTRRYMDPDVDDDENKSLFEDWDLFKAKLRQVFSPIKESLVAKQKIQTLQQTKSAADYTTTFQQYAAALNWDGEALMEMYKQGLKPAVRRELMRTGASVRTLDELINEAVRLDNELFELKLEEEIYASRSRLNGRNSRETLPTRQTGRQQPRSNQGQRRFAKTPYHQGFYQSRGPEPMHLDTIHQGKPKKEYGNQKLDKQKETRKCYNCDKPGHLARDCRMKNKVIRQLNVITGPTEEDTEEWLVVEKDTEQVLADTDRRSKTPTEEVSLRQQMIDLAEGFEQVMIKPEGLQTFQEALQQALGKRDTVPRPGTPYERDGLAERQATPHPGTKVKGYWDDEADHEDRRPNDKILTSEELAIDTPPASPKLVRQDATLQEEPLWSHTTKNPRRKHKKDTLVNDGQAQVIYDLAGQEDWVSTAEEEYQRRNKATTTTELIPRTDRYLRDTRNSRHGYLHYTSCVTDYCPHHYEEKINASYFPEDKKTCRYQWYDCGKVTCGEHLFDKRTTRYFYGTPEEHNQINGILVNDSCIGHTWQFCLQEKCHKHKQEKEANGYGENETFLGVRYAPGIDPAAATLPTPPASLDSQ